VERKRPLKGENNSYWVEFHPQGKKTTVRPGTTILDAATRAGITIDAPCGGQGRCGRCLVRVERGTVDPGADSYLSSEQIRQGWALSCRATISSDLVVFVPNRGERIRLSEKVTGRKAATPSHLDWPLTPPISQLHLTLRPPDLQDNAADVDRLRTAMTTKCQIEDFSLSLETMRSLSHNLRKANWQVNVTIDTHDQNDKPRLIDIGPAHQGQPLLGVALDIGTTSVVALLVDLKSGQIINQTSMLNQQRACGEDVISRIIYSERRGGTKHLARLVIQTINDLLKEFSSLAPPVNKRKKIKTSDIKYMVVAGNTTMTQMLLSLPATHIRQEPYVPTTTYYPLTRARTLGVKINPEALVYCFPAIAAYLGGDIIAGTLSSHLFQNDELSLFLDIGTNGEMVLGNADWMISCACSAGPAFEGGGVDCGMPATSGAIEDVIINSNTLEPTISVIDDLPPRGICGSGMIAILAEMLTTGIIDQSGNIKHESKRGSPIRRGERGMEYVICRAADSASGKDITINESDIDNIIRTKAAIYAGMMVLLNQVGITMTDIERVLIGGAFGEHINVESAIKIGLLPDLPWEKFQFLGNTSLAGAYNVLLSCEAQRMAEEITEKITYVELISDSTFMSEFTAASFLPHTNMENFPSLKSNFR
jgi:uncharacterized 2Fe-2S/4Fe-4S cluster protein (DUF4445 family)